MNFDLVPSHVYSIVCTYNMYVCACDRSSRGDVTVSAHSCFVKLGTMVTFELQAAPGSTSAFNSSPLQVDPDVPQTVSLTDRLGSRPSFRRKSYTWEDKIRVLVGIPDTQKFG